MEHGEQVHLLLSAPGQPPLALPPSSWRAWHATDAGLVDPVNAALGLRLSPVSPRAERTLVAAVANDDIDSLGRLAAQGGATQEPAAVLAALRMVTIDAVQAVEMLGRLVGSPSDPTDAKILRKHWSDIVVQVGLAPGVPALVGLGRVALALVAVELLVEQGRPGEALALLDTLPPSTPVVLAHAATLLANGDHARVLEVTAELPNTDDVSALAYVARSVAARSLQDLPASLDAVCEALSAVSQNPAVIAAGLEERAHVYSLAGETKAARDDLEALTGLAAGQTDVTVPRPSLLRRGDEEPEEAVLDRARHRLRRRITGVGEPGTFGGRHHSTYRDDEIATMFALGQVEAVEDLLLGLLDAVEDEVDELGTPLDATFFLTLADLYQDSARTEDLHALRERYAAADARARAIGTPEPAVTAEAAVTVEPAVAVEPAPTVEPAPVVPPLSLDKAEAVMMGEERTDAPAASPTPAVGRREGASLRQRARGGVMVAVAEPEGPAEPAPDGEEIAVSLVEPRRELTAVERAVRGPRVRSL